jgi:hypothetical protein
MIDKSVGAEHLRRRRRRGEATRVSTWKKAQELAPEKKKRQVQSVSTRGEEDSQAMSVVAHMNSCAYSWLERSSKERHRNAQTIEICK